MLKIIKIIFISLIGVFILIFSLKKGFLFNFLSPDITKNIQQFWKEIYQFSKDKHQEKLNNQLINVLNTKDSIIDSLTKNLKILEPFQNKVMIEIPKEVVITILIVNVSLWITFFIYFQWKEKIGNFWLFKKLFNNNKLINNLEKLDNDLKEIKLEINKNLENINNLEIKNIKPLKNIELKINELDPQKIIIQKINVNKLQNKLYSKSCSIINKAKLSSIHDAIKVINILLIFSTHERTLAIETYLGGQYSVGPWSNYDYWKTSIEEFNCKKIKITDLSQNLTDKAQEAVDNLDRRIDNLDKSELKLNDFFEEESFFDKKDLDYII